MKTPKNGDKTLCAEDGGGLKKTMAVRGVGQFIDGWFASKPFSGKGIDDTYYIPLTLPIYNIEIFFGIM